MNRFKIFWMAICLVAAACSMGIHGARADVLLSFPLPTNNLNLMPGDANYADRSNFGVTWPTLNYPVTDPYKIAGDSFSIGSAGQQYHIDSITLWMVFGFSDRDGTLTQYSNGFMPDTNIKNLALWFGPEGGVISKTSFSEVHPRTWYSTGENFLRATDGVWVGLREITFATDLNINGGQTYNYFLDGFIVMSYVSDTTTDISTWHVPSVHLTKSDGTFYWYEVGTGDIIPSTSSSRDVNVEIKGTLVCNPAPLPSSLLLLGSCLGVLALGIKK